MTTQYTKIPDVEAVYQPTSEELYAANMCFRSIRILGILLGFIMVCCVFMIMFVTPDVLVNIILKFTVDGWNFWGGFGWGVLITIVSVPMMCCIAWFGYSTYNAIKLRCTRPDLVDWDYNPKDYWDKK